MWTDYELGSFISMRDELMNGDLRSLYIVWLAAQRILGSYDEEEHYEIYVPSVPPGLAKPTAAQQELADLFQVPQELLEAVAQHSQATTSSTDDDFAAWLALLPPERCNDYLLRLARNEPGLSRLLVKELRKLNQSKANAVAHAGMGEHVTYATLLTESKVLRDRWEQEEHEKQQAEHQRHMLDVYNRQDEYWQQINLIVARGSGTAYDEATRLLNELRDTTSYLQANQEFQECFSTWVQPHLRRPALIKRLQDRQFPVPRG